MNVRTIDFTAPDAATQFARSLHETGFAVIRNHPVMPEVLQALYDGWREFFLGADKENFLYDPDNYDGTQQGYHPADVSETAVGHTTKDLKEFFHFIPDGNNPPYLAPQTLDYRNHGMTLGRELLTWIQDQTPTDLVKSFPEPLPDMLCPEASLLRILHYPPLTGDEAEDAVRAAAHEDINLITLLPVAEQPGLQVRDNQGNWIDVATLPGELVVNSGDMLRELTDGYYPSTTHRVLNPGGSIANVSRISIPFFITAKMETRLSDRYTAASYLDERLKLLTRLN